MTSDSRDASAPNDRRTLRDTVQDLVRQWDGPLTRDLLRAPGRFGLGQVPSRLEPTATTTLVCGFCSTGCGLTAHLQQGVATNLSPDPRYPVNLGMACPKGWEALSPLDAEDRALDPLLRGANGALQPVTWDVALDRFCTEFKSIQQRHGPESVAFLSTGQIATEEMIYLGALAKIGMGMIHGDGNTRQCMATAVSAYKESFGFDAPPYSYADFEASDVIVLVGSNLCIAHPIQWERICKNPNAPEIIVVDPRRTETAEAATDHYAIEPRSDLSFFYGVAHILIENGWVDRSFVDAHTEGFEAFADHVRAFKPEAVEAATGIPANRLHALARSIHEGKAVSFWWTMGVNQGHEAVRVAQSLIDLALLTGNIGRPGTGANSITGQCNAMGSRLFSNTTNLFAGRDFENPGHRREVADILGVPAGRIPDQNSLAYDEIIEGIHAGRIRGLWVVATNPGHSWIEQAAFREAIAKLDFLVVQDLYTTTETAELADLVLPAAGWGEKEGTFINSERRFGLLQKVRRAPGRALADFHIFQLVAEAWGCRDWFAGWDTPEDVFQVLKELSRGRPCDVSGISDYAAIDAAGGLQWPLPEGEPVTRSERRLFADGRFYRENARALFCFAPVSPLPEAPNADYPFALLTGRGSSSQWHTETRTAKSAVLQKLHRRGPYVEIHATDAQRLGIAPEDRVQVETRRGSLEAHAVIGSGVQPGQLFLPMHDSNTNQLTLACFDPISHQPSYKHCAARIERL